MTKIHCKRLLCVITSLLMIISMLPTGLFAEDTCTHTNYEAELVSTLKEANCTTTGVGKYICSNCGETYYATIPVSHSWDDGEVTKEATCTEEGEITFTCTLCEATETEAIEKTAHTYEVTVTDATCTEPAKVGYFCSVCGAEDPENPAEEVGEALGHTAGKTEITDPTCTENAHAITECTVCGEVIEDEDLGELGDEYKATGHTVVTDEAVEATCSSTGLTEGSHCSVCGEVLVAQEEVPVDETAHVYETEVIKAATCTTNGVGKLVCSGCGAENGYVVIEASHTWDEGEVTTEATCTEAGVMTYTCTVCEATKTEEIPATGHTYVEVIETAATCGEAGSAHKYCTVCGDETESYEIEATGEHTYKETVTDATCTEPAKVGYFCEVCGAEDPDNPAEEVGDALGHSWDSGEYQEATCTTAECVVYTCTVCGETYTEETGLADATGHTAAEAVKENEVAVTCTKDGSYDSVVYCSVCGKELSRETVTVASTGTEHDYEVTVLREADCYKTGIQKNVCTICGTSSYSVIPVTHDYDGAEEQVSDDLTYVYVECNICGAVKILGYTGSHVHTTEVQDAVAATCTTDGYTGDTVCTVCGETIETGEVIPATGHTYVEETRVEATCVSDGYTTYKCSVCGTEETDVIPATGVHTYEAVVTEPTCTEGGYTTYTCSVCGDSYVTNETEATGHTTEVKDAKKATCTEDGYTGDTVCSVCGETIETGEVIPATEHNYEAEVTEPTCTKGGYTTYTCSVCGDSYVADETEATGHTPAAEVANAKEATCTEEGYTGDTVCSVCGETIETGEVIPATGHSDGVLQLIDGVWYVVCPDCGEILS